MKSANFVALRTMMYLVIFLAAFCVFLWQSEVAEGDLVAHWKLDKGSGDTIEDSSGEGNNGVFANGEPKWVAGIGGSALEFDGDDHVKIDAWITETGAADFSITAWVKTTTTGVSFLTKNNDDLALDIYEKLFYIGDAASSEGGLTGTAEWVGHSCDWIRGSNTDVADGEWHHVAVTWEIKAGDGHIYVDGVEGTSYMGYNGGEDIEGDTVQIGFTSGWEAGEDYVGMIDDIRIYDHTLSADEVMGTTAAVSPTGKLAVKWGMIKE